MGSRSQLVVLDETVRMQMVEQGEYISLTDIAKFKNPDAPADIIKNWLRCRSTIDLLGLWEKLNNPGSKLVEFDQFRLHAGENAFVLSPKKWIESTQATGLISNPDEKGNIRDFANGAQLVCLAHMESLNAHFISEGLPQPERLIRLNQLAIRQMRVLTAERNTMRLENNE